MIIITATGRDRPGMVAAISQKLFAEGCNIEDTTMTRLCGEFAMILVVAPPPGLSTAALQERLASLRDSHGLHLSCNAMEEAAAVSTPEEPAARYVLSVYGPDRTGLVARLAGVLAAHDVNITDLQTRVASGHALYIMIFELELPASSAADRLQTALDETARELDVSLTLRPLEEDTL